MIDLPDVRQKKDFDCGHAAVAAVTDLFGLPRPPDLSNAVDGTSPDTAEAVLRRAGLRVLAGHMTVSDLKHLTDRGAPVLCPVVLPDQGGHWVVVRGVARRVVYYHDPEFGPRSLGVAKWLSAWDAETRAGRAYNGWGIAAWGPR